MMTCEQLIEFLADYRSGELPEDKREVFEQHLKLCPPCVKYLDTYCETVDMAKDACKCDKSKPPKMPESLIEAILKACCGSDGNDPECSESEGKDAGCDGESSSDTDRSC